MSEGFTTGPPPGLLADVERVLVHARRVLREQGWRRDLPQRGRVGGLRLLDAITVSAVREKGDAAIRAYAITCAVMATIRLTGCPPHELLPDSNADEYLSPDTPTARLSELDAIALNRYNTEYAGGAADAAELLAIAVEIAADVVAAQFGPTR